PNMVGYRQESSVKPWIAPAAAGGVGARLAYTAARPNISGKIASGESKIKGLEDSIANELKYKKPRADLLQRHRLDLGRAQRASGTTKKIIAARHTPRLRTMRGVAGGTLMAGAGALALRNLKRQRDAASSAPPMPGGPYA